MDDASAGTPYLSASCRSWTTSSTIGARSPGQTRCAPASTQRILRTSLYRRIFRGVWIRRDAWTRTRHPIDAALALHPPEAVRQPLQRRPPVTAYRSRSTRSSTSTVFEPDDRRYRREVKSHVTQHPLPVVTWHGRRVTHPYRTFVDLAGWISLVDLVVLGDAMLRVLKLRADDLVAFCRSSTDYYAGLARERRVVRPRGRGLAHGDPPAHVDRAGRSARADGQPPAARRARAGPPPPRPELPRTSS